jgi:hypothetical protein
MNTTRAPLAGMLATRDGLTPAERAALADQVERIYRARCAAVGRADALSPERVAAWVDRQAVYEGDDMDPCTWVDALEFDAHTHEFLADLEGSE